MFLFISYDVYNIYVYRGSGANNGIVDTNAIDVDRYMYENPYSLLFFAVGNNGPSNNSIQNPATSKNCISIGSSNTNIPSVAASFSSRGPTADGRYGVDILTPGIAVSSAYGDATSTSTCKVVSMSGTSMSTPSAAAAGALIRQYFMNPTYWTNICNKNDNMCKVFIPLSSTIKAVLINSAYPVTYT